MPKRKKIKKVKKVKKVKKSKLKVSAKITEKKNILPGQDEKPEIKKVKKQPTEKKAYNIKDFVVYPKHGVGKIISIEKAKIGEIDIQFYKILVEKEKLTLTVPINQQSKLRPISSINQINKCISILKTKPKIKRTMWSRRAQEYDQKINSGKIYELAEVVKDLNKNTVYPKHGVGKIISIEKAKIGEIDIQFYKILVEKEKLTLTVPINQQSKLRPISSINQINKCISILKTKPKIKRTMWSRRAQEYDQKINSGKIYELAEVVKDLNKNTDIIADQSYSERQLFEKAYDRLKSEFEAVLKIASEEVQKKMDKALGRVSLSEQAE